MHSRSIVALCSLAALATGAGALSAQGRADTRPGLAVFPIWNSGSYGQDKENFDALQKGMAAMIISELAANPGARVVEREELQRLLDEQPDPDGRGHLLLARAAVPGPRAEGQSDRDVQSGARGVSAVRRGHRGAAAPEDHLIRVQPRRAPRETAKAASAMATTDKP